MSIVSRIFGLLGYVSARQADVTEPQSRSPIYAVNEMLYGGSIYATRANGGALEDVLERYIGEGYTNANRYWIFPYFMPFKEIVNTYQNVMPGTWGGQIKPVKLDSKSDVDPKLSEPLGKIWRASNLDTRKATLIQWAANYGTVGIRVSADPATDDAPARSVIGFDHPSHLFNFEEDRDGNTTSVVLKYQKKVNFGTNVDPDFHLVEVVEQINQDEFSRTYDGAEQLEDEQRENGLGFCPYVMLRHIDNGTPYGDWAYKGSESVVHRINWRISRQDKSINRHEFPKWFAAAGGPKPQNVPMDDESLSYVQMTENTPPPIFEPLVPKIDQNSSLKFWTALRDELRGRQPELNFNDVKLIAGLSGETISQALLPTAEAIKSVRPGYDHAFIRAMQMAVSAGIVVGAWDVGTGTGTVEASDKAYRTGVEDFQFAERPALPLTPQQRLVEAQAKTAEQKDRYATANAAPEGVSDRERLRIAGYSDAQIDAMAKEDELPSADDEEETVE